MGQFESLDAGRRLQDARRRARALLDLPSRAVGALVAAGGNEPLERRLEALEARLDHERLYPLEWVNRRVRDAFGNEVQAGPFAGLRYPDWAMTRVDGFAPKVLGTYELELRGMVEELVAGRPEVVVNVGAADGYYAVGLARRLPDATVHAYETDPDRREMLQGIARHNDVGERVVVRAECALEDLREHAARRAAIVCDCDGCEVGLLDPAAVPGLASCALLVETHDRIVAATAATLAGRFAPTHDLRRIATRPRFRDDHPELAFLPYVTQELALLEFRGAPMEWLSATPR